jgi:hypothetical protein
VNAEALVFLDELNALAARHPNLRVIPNPDDEKGLLSAAASPATYPARTSSSAARPR